MAAFLLKDASGKVVLDLTANLNMYVETIPVTLPQGSRMPEIFRKLDVKANRERWWAYIASGELRSGNGNTVESYSNGVSCVVITKEIAIESGMSSNLTNQMDDLSTYLIIYDCRAYHNVAYQQTIEIHLGRC